MLKHNNYENMNLSQIFDTFSHYQQVDFALYCSKDVESLANDQRVIDCNLAVEHWLKGEEVNLELVRNNVRNASSSCASAAAFHAAAAAFHAAYYVVSAASLASSAKSYNLCPNNYDQREIARDQFFNEYKQIAQNWLSNWTIPNFPKEEPDFPLFDFLQDYNLISYLLPKKEDYYYLNLNGFDIKHHNEAELLKLIDTTHIKNILRKIINNR